MNLVKHISKMAQQDIKTIVFPEAGFSDRIIEAVKIATNKKLAKAILLGDESALFLRYSTLTDENIQIVNPKTSELKESFANEIYELRKSKGMTKEEAETLAEDPIYFATMMVKNGFADGMVSGAESTSASTFRPALQLIKSSRASKPVSSSMLFFKNNLFNNKIFLISDCALIENPTKQGLVEIAKNSVDFWKMLFFDEPKVAFLSYSTKGSAKGKSIDMMRNAAELFKKASPEVISDGELQFDVAISPRVAKIKGIVDGPIKGDANILIVPDINSGSLLAKALHSIGGYLCIGPVTQGLARPVNDVTRNSSIKEIVLLIAITAIQAQI
ncbi:MAG: phosphate acyltransferase [Clostridia bacterium]|jgi:phosphate acetyltransferase|nr:phosphate acyltransferase [Clostridia bacterium]MDD3862615.1 phosphate acyltransferase [Clostridia bacterium]